MPAILRLEAIGDDRAQLHRGQFAFAESLLGPGGGERLVGRFPATYWVAEVTDLCPKYRFARQFLSGQKDYSRANRVGSRGVFVFYTLEEGRLYEVEERTSWRSSRRYFARVESYQVVEMTEKEAIRWLCERA